MHSTFGLDTCLTRQLRSCLRHEWLHLCICRQASRSFLSLPGTTGFITTIDVGMASGATYSIKSLPCNYLNRRGIDS